MSAPTTETAADAARSLGWKAGDLIEADEPERLLRVRVGVFGSGMVLGSVVAVRPVSAPEAAWEIPRYPPPWIAVNADDVRRCRKVGA